MLGNQLHSQTSTDGRPRARPKSNWRFLSATLAPSIVIYPRSSFIRLICGALLAAVGVAAGAPGTAIAASPAAPVPHYSIQAIRFADSPQDKVAEMVIGAPHG